MRGIDHGMIMKSATMKEKARLRSHDTREDNDILIYSKNAALKEEWKGKTL